MDANREEPLVSVVVPAHNAGKTLQALLDSVLRQTWRNLEVVVVDDGSTDDTGAVAERAAKADGRLRVIRQENRGVSAARNAALDCCTGKYLRFADADDTLPRDSIEKTVLRAERDGSELVIGGYTQYLGDMHSEHNLARRDDTVPCDEIMDHLCFHANSIFYGVLWNKLFLRETAVKAAARFREDMFWGEDFVFVMDFMKKTGQISFMKETLYDYRRSLGSTTFRQTLSCVSHPLLNIRIKREMYRHLREMYKSRGQYERYRNRLWMYLFRVGLG